MQKKYQDSSYSGSDDDKAWIPGESYKTMFGDKYLDNFVFQVEDARNVEAATDKMLAVLARRHQFDPEDREALMMWDTTEMMSFFEDFILLFQSFLAVLGTLTLVVGGIGVSNIMNVVVEERTPEIGLKMALGAKRRYVMGQFLLETFLITLVGGAVGFAIGWGVCMAFPSLGLEQYVGNPTISAKIALGTVAVLGLISLIAGWFPARTAANLNPVEALKM
jgi:putative ABC transport system permease protein